MSTLQSHSHLGGWRFRALLLSVLLATIGYLGFSLWGGWEDVMAAFVLIGWTGTCIALALSLLNYGLRFVRWQIYLQQLGHSVPILPSLRIYLSGFALTTTPGKAGELFRCLLLKQRDVSYPASFAAFISERLSDLVAIILLTLLGMTFYPESQALVFFGAACVAGLIVLISSQSLQARLYRAVKIRTGRLADAFKAAIHMLAEARRCHSLGVLLFATCISLVAWGAEGLAFYWVLMWLNVDVPFTYALFVYALSMLAGALSFMPGGLGGAEATMITLLLLHGMAMPEAVAATVFIRLATLWFAVFLGLIALFYSRKGEVS
jgi:uncharacterized protein (TIRG00374 family)